MLTNMLIKKEEWKSITDWEFYEVSNYGRVRSIDKVVKSKSGSTALKKGKLRTLTLDKDGYYGILLYDGKRKKRFLIHRLVAQAFLPNPLGLPQINHKDEVKTNNSVENLEWCDCSYNINYGTRNERVGKKLKDSNSTARQVVQKTLTGDVVKVWRSVKSVKEGGFKVSGVMKACQGYEMSPNGKKWNFTQHKGYKWEYLN